ncbi:helix-turn-helix domain-containing protein [Catenuloplanes sp. NPDC051500]|uniref:helix-turn-helix domain-containing protein n=1 Tax=Catenuloplanes sp. NPDC051500 TaxID=3363959 RepID=UPI0037BBCE1E
MSIEALAWAIDQAPNLPAHCAMTLVGLANHAHADGTAAFPSVAKLARYARKSESAIKRDIKELLKLKLIVRGNQAYVAHLPADRRPVVYNLALHLRRPIEIATEPVSGKGDKPAFEPEQPPIEQPEQEPAESPAAKARREAREHALASSSRAKAIDAAHKAKEEAKRAELAALLAGQASDEPEPAEPEDVEWPEVEQPAEPEPQVPAEREPQSPEEMSLASALAAFANIPDRSAKQAQYEPYEPVVKSRPAGKRPKPQDEIAKNLPPRGGKRCDKPGHQFYPAINCVGCKSEKKERKAA